MALPGGSAFFPPLNECLNEDKQLLSWKYVYDVLCDPCTAPTSDVVEQFLTDERSIGILSAFYEPFRPSTPESRSRFETATAAINVTPSDNERYDIRQIKDDALWLSQEARIDEISALRLTILEWQSKAEVDLLRGLSEKELNGYRREITAYANENFSSVQDASAQDSMGFLARHALRVSTDYRRHRLVGLYVSERCHIVRVGTLLVLAAISPASSQASLQAKTLADGSRPTSLLPWMGRLGGIILEAQKSGRDATAHSHFLLICIEALNLRMDRIAAGLSWYRSDEDAPELEAYWTIAQLVEVTNIMDIVVVLVSASDGLLTLPVMRAWFQFSMKNDFFEHALPTRQIYVQEALIPLIQSLVAIISLSVLKIPQAIDSINSTVDSPDSLKGKKLKESIFFFDVDAMKEINAHLVEAASKGLRNAGPAIFGWSIILQNIRACVYSGINALESPISPNVSTSATGGLDSLRTVLETVQDSSYDGDVIALLANAAVHELQVYDLITVISTNLFSAYASPLLSVIHIQGRLIVLDLIRAGLSMTQYSAEVLHATLAVLSAVQTSGRLLEASREVFLAPATAFLSDEEVLLPGLLQESRLRFPYELLPFLRLCNALISSHESSDESGSKIVHLLEHMSSFTQLMPPLFREYEPTLEDEHPNHVRLIESLPLFSSSQRRKMLGFRGHEIATTQRFEDGYLEIPKGAHGYMIKESQPRVIVWEHSYSALMYLPVLLSTFISGSDNSDFAMMRPIERDTAGEIISLFVVLMASSIKSSDQTNDRQKESAPHVFKLLEEASEGLDRDQNLVSIISRIFEQEIQSRIDQLGDDDSLGLLNRCVQFFHVLTIVDPGRTWLLLAQSQFTDMNGSRGFLATVIASTEAVSGRYEFLNSCLHLFEALVEDAVISAVSRRGTRKTRKRFESSQSGNTDVPDRVMADVLLAFEKILFDVWLGLSRLKFMSQHEKDELQLRFNTVFEKILFYTYGFGEASASSKTMLNVLIRPAEFLIARIITSTEDTFPAGFLIASCAGSLESSVLALTVTRRNVWISHTKSALALITTLLRLTVLLDLPSSRFESEILGAVPVLVHLLVIHNVYRRPVIILLQTLMEVASRHHAEPPSLLGHLGDTTLQGFVGVLCKLGGPLNDDRLEIHIWRLLSTFVSCKQHWFAVFLLGGTSPKVAMKLNKPTESPRPQRKTFLALTLDKASEVQSMSTRKALALFEFILTVQNHWPWTTTHVRNHAEFLQSIAKFFKQLKSRPGVANTDGNPFNELLLASIMARILALCISGTLSQKEGSELKALIRDVSPHVIDGFNFPEYNTSLHYNLKRNLESRFAGFTLESFRRTVLTKPELGQEYYYDLNFASKVLGFDASWCSHKSRSFRDEFIRANINLSMVNARISLLNSWKLLMEEVSQFVAVEGNVEEQTLTQIVTHCLEGDFLANLPDNASQFQVRDRLDLAFVSMQMIKTRGVRSPTASTLLRLIWDAIRKSTEDFSIALESDATGVYRYLLKLLLLSLQCHLANNNTEPSNGDNGHISQRASKGSNPPNNAPPCVPQLSEILVEAVGKGFIDLAHQLHHGPARCSPLDFALLIAILRTVLRIPGVSMLHSQVTLHLSNTGVTRYATSLFSWCDQLEGNFTYGELSVTFLVELSKMPPMAEQLAVDGILSQLSTANLTKYFRASAGVGPLDETSRLYSIWTRGILPLCLNLLNAVQAPVASEVVSFLNQFPSQLSRTASQLRSKGSRWSKDPYADSITLSMTFEIFSLALIAAMLERTKLEIVATGVGDAEIPELAWDKNGVKEELEGLLQARRSLRERICPVDEGEAELAKLQPKGADGTTVNRLEENVVQNLRRALDVLQGSDRD